MKAATVLHYAKALVGGAAAGVAAYVPAQSDGHITSGEWWTIVLAVLVGAGVVGATPNAKKPAQ